MLSVFAGLVYQKSCLKIALKTLQKRAETTNIESWSFSSRVLSSSAPKMLLSFCHFINNLWTAKLFKSSVAVKNLVIVIIEVNER